MKLNIKSTKSLTFNSVFKEHSILKSVDSIPQDLKFSYNRKNKIKNLKIASGVLAALVVLFFIKVVPVEDNLFFCAFFFIASYLLLQWYELEDSINYQFTTSQFSVNDVHIPWNEVTGIDELIFKTGSSAEGTSGLRITAPNYKEIVIVTNTIKDFDFANTELPQLFYLFWKRGQKLKSESVENQDS